MQDSTADPRRSVTAMEVADPTGQGSRLKSITRAIQTWYGLGFPLFSRESLQSIRDQLHEQRARPLSDTKITVTGLYDIEREVLLWRRSRPDEPEPKKSSLYIEYRSIQELTREFDDWFFPGQEYLPISFGYFEGKNPALEASPSTSSLSSDTTRQIFQAMRADWRTGEYFKNLQGIWDREIPPLPVDKIVGLKCGPLLYRRQPDERPMIQHSLILDLKEFVLNRGKSEQCRCYAQDPSYSDDDVETLKHFDITVLDDPSGFLEVDSRSILISISPNVPVKQIIADLCRPAIIVWNSEGKPWPCTDPHSPRVDKMLETEYTKVAVPYHECFGDISMYYKKSV